MNLVLFESNELGEALPRTDRRAQHVLGVLKRTVGDAFDAGVVNGRRGRATITEITKHSLSFVFDGVFDPAPPAPITLLVGLPRPQTARDILRDATTLGVGAIHFALADRSETSYAQSSLWTSNEWRRQLVVGAEQAFDTRLPEVSHGMKLQDILAKAPTGSRRLALDNYEATQALGDATLLPQGTVILAIGSERGWSAAERDTLRTSGFTVAHLGTRVLRTETAVIAALTVVRSKLGLM